MKMPVVTDETARKVFNKMKEKGFSKKILQEIEKENPYVFSFIRKYAERCTGSTKQAATCGFLVYLLFKLQLESDKEAEHHGQGREEITVYGSEEE